jgi:hypothetical protein
MVAVDHDGSQLAGRALITVCVARRAYCGESDDAIAQRGHKERVAIVRGADRTGPGSLAFGALGARWYVVAEQSGKDVDEASRMDDVERVCVVGSRQPNCERAFARLAPGRSSWRP